MPEAFDGLADIARLVEAQIDVDAGGHAEELRKRGPDGVHDLDGVRSRLLVDAQKHRALAVDADDRDLRLRRVLDTPNVAQADLGRAHAAHDDVLHGLDHGELVIGEYVVVEGADLDVTRGQEEVGVVDGLRDLIDREPLRVEPVAIQIDGDLPDLPAVHVRGSDPGQALELRLDRVVGEVVESPLVEAAARDGDDADRDVRQI